MSDNIRKLTGRVFRSFHFDPDKASVEQIQKVLEPGFKGSTDTVSLSAVGVPRASESRARSCAESLHRQIHNKVSYQKERAELSKYLLAGALLFSKLQEDPVKCKKILSALSKTSPKEEIDLIGYENFGLLFNHFSSLSDQDRMAKFEQLRAGAQKKGENSCQEFGQSFNTASVRQTWSQNFAGMMKCFESDEKVLGCLEKK